MYGEVKGGAWLKEANPVKQSFVGEMDLEVCL